MPRPLPHLFAVFAVCALLTPAAAYAQTPADPKRTADRLTGDDKGSAANNAQCKLFTPAEAAKFIGEPVKAGENAAMGSGCQWDAVDGDGDVGVQVVPANYHANPTDSRGYKALPNIGTQGFVAVYMNGWMAGAIVGKEAVLVSVAGAAASDATAVALLQEAIKRRKP